MFFDRSWYNRGGVEKAMGFRTAQEHPPFLRQTPIFEQMLLHDGILLRKYWFSVPDGEQLRRFKPRPPRERATYVDDHVATLIGDREQCRYSRLVRVYIPATLTMLQQLVADGSMHARSGTAFAVTPTLRESYFEGDEDELGEVALREAALASLRLLAAEGTPADGTAGLPLRRAVLVAEVDGATARPDLDDAVVRLAGPVGMTNVVAAYLDNADAEPAVSDAIEVIDSADLGDEDAELTVGDAQDHDLAWYASQELPFLLELLDTQP